MNTNTDRQTGALAGKSQPSSPVPTRVEEEEEEIKTEYVIITKIITIIIIIIIIG